MGKVTEMFAVCSRCGAHMPQSELIGIDMSLSGKARFKDASCQDPQSCSQSEIEKNSSQGSYSKSVNSIHR